MTTLSPCHFVAAAWERPHLTPGRPQGSSPHIQTAPALTMRRSTSPGGFVVIVRAGAELGGGGTLVVALGGVGWGHSTGRCKHPRSYGYLRLLTRYITPKKSSAHRMELPRMIQR